MQAGGRQHYTGTPRRQQNAPPGTGRTGQSGSKTIPRRHADTAGNPQLRKQPVQLPEAAVLARYSLAFGMSGFSRVSRLMNSSPVIVSFL